MGFHSGFEAFDLEWETREKGITPEPNGESRIRNLRSYSEQILETDQDWEISKLVNTAFSQVEGSTLSELAYTSDAGLETARNLINMTLAFNS